MLFAPKMTYRLCGAIFVLTIITAPALSDVLGDSCVTPLGSPGICKYIRTCYAKMAYLRKLKTPWTESVQKFILTSKCEIDPATGRFPICCPEKFVPFEDWEDSVNYDEYEESIDYQSDVIDEPSAPSPTRVTSVPTEPSLPSVLRKPVPPKDHQWSYGIAIVPIGSNSLSSLPCLPAKGGPLIRSPPPSVINLKD